MWDKRNHAKARQDKAIKPKKPKPKARILKYLQFLYKYMDISSVIRYKFI